MSLTLKAAIQALTGRIADAYTAISQKGGTLPATQDSANLPTAIASIPSGSAEEPEEKDVLFLDYDGTILYSYTWEEFEDVTALPSASDLPTHEWLTFARWTNTLDELKKSSPLYTGTGKHRNKITMAGAMYNTNNGNFYIFIELFKDGQTFSFSLPGFDTVSWGDGTSDQTFSHTYNKAGKYTIIVQRAEGQTDFKVSDNNSKQAIIGVYCDSVGFANYSSIYQGGLENCVQLKEIVAPTNKTLLGGNDCLSGCYGLKAIVTDSIGGMHRTLYGTMLKYCTSWVTWGANSGTGISTLRRVNFQDGCLNLHDGNRSLQYIWLNPNNGVSTLSNCVSLRELHLPYTSIPSLGNTNYFNNVPTTCTIYVKTGLLSSYETATNWSTIYAQYTFVEED